MNKDTLEKFDNYPIYDSIIRGIKDITKLRNEAFIKRYTNPVQADLEKRYNSYKEKFDDITRIKLKLSKGEI